MQSQYNTDYNTLQCIHYTTCNMKLLSRILMRNRYETIVTLQCSWQYVCYTLQYITINCTQDMQLNRIEETYNLLCTDYDTLQLFK